MVGEIAAINDRDCRSGSMPFRSHAALFHVVESGHLHKGLLC